MVLYKNANIECWWYTRSGEIQEAGTNTQLYTFITAGFRGHYFVDFGINDKSLHSKHNKIYNNIIIVRLIKIHVIFTMFKLRILINLFVSPINGSSFIFKLSTKICKSLIFGCRKLSYCINCLEHWCSFTA